MTYTYTDWLDKLDLCVELVHKVDVHAQDKVEAFEQLGDLSRSDAHCRSIMVAMIAWRMSQILPDSVGSPHSPDDQGYGQLIARVLTARLRAIYPAVSLDAVSEFITALVSASARLDELTASPEAARSYAQRLKNVNAADIDNTIVTLAVGLIDPTTAGDMIDFIATERAWKVASVLAG